MTIPITAEAFAAIRAAFSGDWSSDIRPDGKGGYLLTLPEGMVDLLEGIRGPGEFLFRRDHPNRQVAVIPW